MTMQASEKLFLQTVGRFVADRWKAWAAPLVERLEKIENFLNAQPADFTDRQRAVIEEMLDARLRHMTDAVTSTHANSQTALNNLDARVEKMETAFAAQPTAFTNAQRVVIQEAAEAAAQAALLKGQLCTLEDIETAIAKIPAGPPGPPGSPGPAGKDGINGADGVDGKSVTANDVAGLVADAVSVAVAGLPVQPHVVSGYIDRGGDLYFSNSDGHA